MELSVESTVDFIPGPLDRGVPLFIAGHGGMVDAALHRHLSANRFTDLLAGPAEHVNLEDRQATFDFFGRYRPAHVVLVASQVPSAADFGELETNVLAAATHTGVHRLLFVGASGHARIAEARRRYGLHWISARTTGWHGPVLDPTAPRSDVLSALIERYVHGHANAEPVVTNPGSADNRLELLHVDDLADACLHLLEHFDGPRVVNIGSGTDHTVGDVADVVATAVGYSGETRWDASKPAVQARPPLDVGTLWASGWRPGFSMIQGIVETVSWYQSGGTTLRR
jgi:GDP-L-fucose synthase